MSRENGQRGAVAGPIRTREEIALRPGPITRSWLGILLVATAGFLAWLGPAAVALSATAPGPKPPSAKGGAAHEKSPVGAPPEVVLQASQLPKNALSEFAFWKEPASPGGKMVGTANAGGELDPPPEDDPHVTLKVPVQRGVPYRCWIHMKVGKPKGKSKANLFYVQFSDAVDAGNKEVFKLGTRSYLSVRGPEREGWTWVGRDLADPKSSEPLIQFRTSGEVTVRLQAGMEGVGFDQFLLSPARFREKPPAEAVVKK